VKKRAVHFGAGNIGLGVVAQFLHASGHRLVFADVDQALIGALQAQPSCRVREVGEGAQGADIVTIAIGARILRYLAPVIARGLTVRNETLRLDR
jgi:mannitol-1-phosphate 5-dehydrogenase